MPGKQITELAEADLLDNGDLLLIRKTGMGVDRSLTKEKLIDSLGNSAVNGYTSIKDDTNKITLSSSNSSIVTSYMEGMKISFISPINSLDIALIKIGNLPYKNINKYSLEETIQLTEGEYIEAIYSNGVFRQTNKLNTQLIWSNEYNATTEIAPNETLTTYHLISAVGVKKTHYYQGMSLLFTVPVDSKGISFVNVDGLGNKKLGESGGSKISKDIYENQAIMAIYNGTEFIKQKFAPLHHTPLKIEESAHSLLEEEKYPSSNNELPQKSIDTWYPDHPCDLNDPANTSNSHDLDSKNKPIFSNIITAGKNSLYKTLKEAITALINDYGPDGGGHKIAIEIDEFSIPEKKFLLDPLIASDYSWITIFAKKNKTLKFLNVTFRFENLIKTPIFNFKISCSYIREGYSLSYPESFITLNPIMDIQQTLIFGKNTHITFHFSQKESPNKFIRTLGNITCINAKYGTLQAKYGLFIQTNTNIAHVGRALINKGHFLKTPYFSCSKIRCSTSNACNSLYENSSLFIIESFARLIQEKSQIYNTEIYFSDSDNKVSDVFFIKKCKIHFSNVKSNNRTNQIKAIIATCGSKVILENCDFSSKTIGTINNGHDIMIYDLKDSENLCIIYLNNTKGNTNIVFNQKINNSIIYNNEDYDLSVLD